MKVELLTKKDGFYSGQKEVIALLRIIPDMVKKTGKRVKKNLSFVIDQSGSMSGPVKNIRPNYDLAQLAILQGGNKRPQMPQPQNNPFDPYPIYPDPFAPFLGQNVADKAVLAQKAYQNIIANAQPAEQLSVAQDKKDALNQYLNGVGAGHQQKLNNVYVPPKIQEMPKTRFELVIEATKVAISQLEADEFASVVLFGSEASVLCPAMPMTAENKQLFISKLNQAVVSGMTNLNGGWIKGVEEVAKNLNDEYINRVIVLTDGDTNVGETNEDNIATNVAGAYKHSVTTTTIGVGEGFKESLLQAMATAGAGNSYFIDDDASVKKTFDMEFTGLSNVNAQEIKVKVEGKGILKFVKNMNLFVKDGDYFKFPTLTSQDINAVFVFEAGSVPSKNNKALKEANAIKVQISYKDVNGKNKRVKLEQEVSLLSKKDYDALPENQDVKVQELLNTIAEQKVQAQQAYKSGNIDGARQLLAASSVMTANVASAMAPDSQYSSMLNDELVNLNSLVASANVAGDETFSKTLSYQAYRTRNAQDKQDK